MCKNKQKTPLRHLFHTLITTFLNYLKNLVVLTNLRFLKLFFNVTTSKIFVFIIAGTQHALINSSASQALFNLYGNNRNLVKQHIWTNFHFMFHRIVPGGFMESMRDYLVRRSGEDVWNGDTDLFCTSKQTHGQAAE